MKKGKKPNKRTYNNKPVPDTNDPYELAGYLLDIDNVSEGDGELADLYYDKAEALLRKWGNSDALDREDDRVNQHFDLI